jgi:nucleoside-diphosphate-sugar epimerase
VIAVTGASSYVGGRILRRLRARGLETIALQRRPNAGDDSARRYALAQPLGQSLLDGVDTVVHAAYDLAARGENVRAVNCAGSLPLLEGVAARGGRVVLISTLSAFDGARSDYGQGKLALEHAVLERGGVVVRPGLVFGVAAGGLFGAMVHALSARALTPLIGGGRQRVFVTHDESLSDLVAEVVAQPAAATGPLFAAHEVPTTLRAIAAEISRTHGRRLHAVPVAPRIAYACLRCGELLRVPLPFRSDSVRSLRHTIPLDQVSALGRSTVEFPPLSDELWAG